MVLALQGLDSMQMFLIHVSTYIVLILILSEAENSVTG